MSEFVGTGLSFLGCEGDYEVDVADVHVGVRLACRLFEGVQLCVVDGEVLAVVEWAV